MTSPHTTEPSVLSDANQLLDTDQVGTRGLLSYPEYRDSDVEWVGDVPAHWKTWKLTHAFKRLGSGTTPRSESEEYYGGEVAWVTTSELRESIITDTAKKLTKKALAVYPTLRVYPAGTLLFAMYGATIGRLGILGIPATVNQACCAFSGPIRINTLFAYYWLQMRRPVLIVLSTGGGQPNLSQDDLRTVRIPAPPLDEQRAITAFLDRETARIDELITKKKRLIELLAEKRTALISHAVTKGLNPDAPMKDSGIDWLGPVPQHWSPRKLGYITTMQGGGTPSKDNLAYWNGSIPWVSPKDMKRRIIDDSVDHVTDEAVSETTIRLIDAPAVLIVVRGMILSHSFPVGLTSVPVTINQDMKAITVRPGTSADFLAYLLQGIAPAFLALVEESGHGTKCLRTDLWKGFELFMPPIVEQEQTCEHLRIETAGLDYLIEKVSSAIDRLGEYRSALISAAVTGKIDVRGEA